MSPKDYVILTDSSADLPWNYYKEHDIPYIPMLVAMGDSTFADDGTFDAHEFFTKLAQGGSATTSQIPSARFADIFEEYLQKGVNVLFMGLSQGLSESCRNAGIARDELIAKYPGRKIHVCATSCASLGLGLFVHEARKRRDEGMDFDSLCAWAEEFKMRIHHLVTVHDLEMLHRGGRISKTSAIVGTILGIKPMIYLSPEGRLQTTGKVRGRKQAMAALVDGVAQCIPGPDADFPCVMISHGDCEDEAREVMRMMKERYTVREEVIHPLGITIGAHIGSGTLALFFEGNPRV